MIGEKGAALMLEDARGGPAQRRAPRGGVGMILDNAQVPLYVQLADLFRQRIVKGVWKQGDKLPSLEQLVAEFEVARVTVRQAIDRLTRDGLVSPQRGRGTFVTGAPHDDRWLRVETTLQNLADVYRDTQPTILNIDESTRSPRARTTADGVRRRALRLHAARPRARGPAVLRDRHLPRRRRSSRATRRASARETVIPLLTDDAVGDDRHRAPGADDLAPPTSRSRATSASTSTRRWPRCGASSPAPKRRVIYLGEVTYRGDFVHVEFDLKA